MAYNAKGTVRTLQKALMTKGVIICLETTQFYSTKKRCLITMHLVKELVDEKKELKLKTANLIDVMKYLAGRWEEINDKGNALNGGEHSE